MKTMRYEDDIVNAEEYWSWYDLHKRTYKNHYMHFKPTPKF